MKEIKNINKAIPKPQPKIITSNKYKLAHSTYSKLQTAKSLINDLKNNKNEPNTDIILNAEDINRAYRIFEYAKKNKYYIGHNVGSLGDDIADELRILGNTNLSALDKISKAFGYNAYKVLNKEWLYNQKEKKKQEDERRENLRNRTPEQIMQDNKIEKDRLQKLHKSEAYFLNKAKNKQKQ